MSLDLEQAAAVARKLGLDEHDFEFKTVPGGDIAEAFVLQATTGWVFLKVLPLEQAGLLSAEADGLKALAETGCIRVPGVLHRGIHDQFGWLALEYLQLGGRSRRCDARLGHKLAELHRSTGESFGWHRGNYIGRTPQINIFTEDWREFFGQHRLAPQFDRLRRRYPDSSWKELKAETLAAWDVVAANHQPKPSLIHGDLWRGNAASLPDDVPVIFDPAVHYADRECDLAMAHLFGGYDEAFFHAYEDAWPLPQGYEIRRLYYKLYHMLNHANMFGRPYQDAAGQLCRRILEH